MDVVPVLVTLHVWGVPLRQVPAAVAAMVTDRREVNRSPNLTFVKLLGTGAGAHVHPAGRRPAALGGPGLLVGPARASRCSSGRPFVRSWDRRADPDQGGERLRVLMRPLASRGRWSGREPFGDPPAAAVRRPGRGDHQGPAAGVARRDVLARGAAGQRPARDGTGPAASRSASARHRSGCRARSRCGTTRTALQAFAYGTPEHADAVRRTPQVGWYREELFARLAVLAATGSLGGVAIAPVT